MRLKLNRSGLYGLVWARPRSEIAKELDISDVMLGKLCREMNVPVSPRGYPSKSAIASTVERMVRAISDRRMTVSELRRPRWSDGVNMTRKLFQPGGPLGIQDLGNDQYQMQITIPKDSDGRLARECHNSDCSPGYFKVTPGTGITGGQTLAYCPYCRHQAKPNDFATPEQVRYGKDLAMREAHKGIQGIIKDALGLGPSGKRKCGGGFISMEMTYKPGTLPHVRQPFEDEVRRDVVCPRCTLDQTVFGLATWCSDCGADIFLTHVGAEVGVTSSMVGDIERRRQLLGNRIAAKDLENCLEDAVSIFEAAMKAMTRRWLEGRGDSSHEVEDRLKKVGNSFQSIARTQEQLAELFGMAVPSDVDWSLLSRAFEKRHPITHNLGVVDRKYLERAQSSETYGREVSITVAEVEAVLTTVVAAVSAVHASLFPVEKSSGTTVPAG